jgi:hypothetical protein
MRLKFSAMLILLVISATCAVVHAQGCPPGQHPVVGQGWNYCAADPESNNASDTSQSPTPIWENRYQSIVTDKTKGILGTSTGKTSSNLAEKAAMADCQAKGGKVCEIQITNENGCVAMVVGNRVMNSSSGQTKDAAERKGIDLCSTEDTDCHVYYSACSLPERIR